MKLKVDENLPQDAVDILRRAGFEADSVWEEGLHGSPDDTIAEVCQREERIILTLDLDFANIVNHPPGKYPGIIVLRLQKTEKPALLAVVERLADALVEWTPKGQLWIVDEDRIRVRG